MSLASSPRARFGIWTEGVCPRTSRAAVRLVLGQAMLPVVIGLVAGGAGSYMAARALTRFLFGVTPADTATFASVAILFAVVALVACVVPARRATRVDPVVALRCE